MSASAEARLIVKYFGTIGKAASRAGQRAAGSPVEAAGRVSKVVSEGMKGETKNSVFMRSHPVTFYPAQMRMAL